MPVVDSRNGDIEPRRVGAGGRPLDISRDAAILRAALEGLAESGYDRLTMDDIAARAHAGKGALYRRWPSKVALIVDAVVAWRDELGPMSFPDTGTLRGDLEAMIAAVPELDEAARRQMAVIIGLATAASHDAELTAALTDNILERPRRILRDVLERAVARGEIPPDRDVSLLPDVLIGLNILRVLSGEALDQAFLRRVFEEVLLPVATAPASRRPPTRREGRTGG